MARRHKIRMLGAVLFAVAMSATAWTKPDLPPLPEAKKDDAKGGADPFDLKHRRSLTESETDLAALRASEIDTSTPGLIGFLKGRTLTDADRAHVSLLVEQMGSVDFRRRERATEALVKKGPAVAALLRAVVNGDNLEAARRAEKCLERIRDADMAGHAEAQAVRVLLLRNPPELSRVLLEFLPFGDGEYVRDEIRDALKRQVKTGKVPLSALVEATKDSLPIRRAVAAEALAESKDHVALVRSLLKDESPLVRLRVAVIEVTRAEKSAVPILIEALTQVANSDAWPAEDLLYRLAEGRSPPMMSRGFDDDSRRKYKEAWLDWWKANEKAVAFGKPPPTIGHTIVTLLDDGEIVELDRKNEPVWRIKGLALPLDMQLLPNGNILVAEHGASRVTERDPIRGEIRWERAVTSPICAQRLANRHTFIATYTGFAQYDENGREVVSFTSPEGERFLKIAKLPNGEVIALTIHSRVVRMDEKGRELSSFTISLNNPLFGGRIQMLPNGHILVPHNGEDKVVEYDTEGKNVWQIAAPKPVIAVRLPNGNTIVTTFLPETGVIEFDREGNEFWSFRHKTRVTRAIRR